MSNTDQYNIENDEMFDEVNHFDSYKDEINSIITNPDTNKLIENLNQHGFEFAFSMNPSFPEIETILSTISVFLHLYKHHEKELENNINTTIVKKETINQFLNIVKSLNDKSFKVLDSIYFTDIYRLKRPRIQEISNFDLSLHEIINEKDEVIGYTPYVDIGITFQKNNILEQQDISIPYDHFKSLLNFLISMDENRCKKSISRYKSKINDILYMER